MSPLLTTYSNYELVLVILIITAHNDGVKLLITRAVSNLQVSRVIQSTLTVYGDGNFGANLEARDDDVNLTSICYL